MSLITFKQQVLRAELGCPVADATMLPERTAACATVLKLENRIIH